MTSGEKSGSGPKSGDFILKIAEVAGVAEVGSEVGVRPSVRPSIRPSVRPSVHQLTLECVVSVTKSR